MASDGATIRHATREDVPAILGLIHELAAYEKSTHLVTATEDVLYKTLSFTTPSSQDSSPATFTPGFAKTILVIAPDGEIAGLGVYFYNFSTWTGVPGIYLEDLFVKPAYRKRGYGKVIMRELAKEVLEVGGQRFEWNCLKWNEPSLQFYKSLGAEIKEPWVQLRVDGGALKRLAGLDG
ncbi:GCN5-related N-acetyltransferas-like protein [Lophiostoma macrostomum CBS 122681]|uniref:GCN5-related N-acetyltransferas-like protein n=1 Tax=Lophiostoma macrostomum CBS 122681 TaxID=1314788 RepID=A0A6A6TK62_9PLEO|nr:GCN5-related N-acetyltransferas-like protein [Lophiostoma macrostomum CBS 122681]